MGEAVVEVVPPITVVEEVPAAGDVEDLFRGGVVTENPGCSACSHGARFDFF